MRNAGEPNKKAKNTAYNKSIIIFIIEVYMPKDDVIEAEGKIIELLPNTNFKVELSNGHIVNAYLSGKLRLNNIKIVEGDRVTIEMSPYDLTKGRITWRAKN
jgi:translation initiation factor IF-1